MNKLLTFIVALFLATLLNAQGTDAYVPQNYTYTQAQQNEQETTYCSNVDESEIEELAGAMALIKVDTLTEDGKRLYEARKQKIRGMLEIRGNLNQQKKRRPVVREHRGFYFATLLGLDVISMKNTQPEDNINIIYNGYSLPKIDFRFGPSILNLLAIHLTMGFSNYIGEAVEKDRLHSNSSNKIKDNENPLMNMWLGPGFTLYPFRDRNSPLNGSFISASVFMELVTFTQNYNLEDWDDEVLFYSAQLELGKDWWVSDAWSVGAALGVGGGLFRDYGNSAKMGRFLFTLRLVHR